MVADVKALIDLNVILDVLQRREPFYDRSAQVLALADLLSILTVAAVDQAVIEQALSLPYPDFEDAVQMMAAVRSGVHSHP